MIDIIIPVYNARSTLEKTLMSILLQQTSCKFIVTIIDDCSLESYDDLLSIFNKYLTINYFKLDQNKGSGITRQFGLEHTSCPYITFLDADDLFFDTDSLENLYKEISSENYDIVSAGEFDEDRNLSFVNEGDLHGKIYRRAYLNRKGIKFNHTRFHEDNYFNSLVLLSGAKNFILTKKVYVYCYNHHSITKKDKKLEFERLEILLSNVHDIFQLVKITDDNISLITHFIFIKYKYYNRIYKNFTEKQKKQFKKWIKIYDPSNLNLIGIEDVALLEQLVLNKYSKKN